MESLVINSKFWKGKSVFLTGHTGFKGSWLALWLTELGAEVHGYSLDTAAEHSFFNACELKNKIASHTVGDINNYEELYNSIKKTKPEFFFHLAAQALVQESYRNPVNTYQTNVMGTLNVLECLRVTPSVKAAVIVTTDKCYENKEVDVSYKETDRLGGYDPYSSSKACAEILTASYRNSFFKNSGTQIATARAGNVIGGGDMAENRLIPDVFRSVFSGQEIKIRNPKSIRPWQHVLEPLSGYIVLAQALFGSSGNQFAEAWNFGPKEKDCQSVEWVLKNSQEYCKDFKWSQDTDAHSHEAKLLKIDSAKAKAKLGWNQTLDLNKAIQFTFDWFNSYRIKSNMYEVSRNQLKFFERVSVEQI